MSDDKFKCVCLILHPYAVGMIITYTLQMRKLRLREVKDMGRAVWLHAIPEPVFLRTKVTSFVLACETKQDSMIRGLNQCIE